MYVRLPDNIKTIPPRDCTAQNGIDIPVSASDRVKNNLVKALPKFSDITPRRSVRQAQRLKRRKNQIIPRITIKPILPPKAGGRSIVISLRNLVDFFFGQQHT